VQRQPGLPATDLGHCPRRQFDHRLDRSPRSFRQICPPSAVCSFCSTMTTNRAEVEETADRHPPEFRSFQIQRWTSRTELAGTRWRTAVRVGLVAWRTVLSPDSEMKRTTADNSVLAPRSEREDRRGFRAQPKDTRPAMLAQEFGSCTNDRNCVKILRTRTIRTKLWPQSYAELSYFRKGYGRTLKRLSGRRRAKARRGAIAGPSRY
jgi:hypothetical protein